ncbi:MAG: hypothetical protein LLG20_16745 [Acidobacteriales bacterium]|nr:hypothetical protein [Terriglobales bacterium]
MPLIRLTHKQLEAARRNGARSRGPKTPEGKARSAMNGFKHGRYAKPACVLRGENKDAFHDLLQSLIHRFQPADEAELNLVRSLASIDWRLARIVAAESRILDVQTAAFLAARESQLTFQRRAVLNQLRQLRRDWPLPAPPQQVVESEPVGAQIPAEPEKIPGIPLPGAA